MRLAGINLISAKLFLLRGTVDALLKINEPQTSNAQLARGEQALVCKIPLSPPLEKGEEAIPPPAPFRKGGSYVEIIAGKYQ